MKKITKMLVLALALVAAFSLGAGSTAEAKKKKVTVKKVTSVDKLTGKKTITLTKGKSANLKTTVTVTPSTKANKKVKYKASNSNVTVTQKGKITAKRAGSAKITVTSVKNSKKKATVKVKVVTGKVKSIKVKAAAKTIKIGQTTTVKATIKTTGKKTNKSVVWTSSNEAVATVDKKGNVVAKEAGKATITAKTTDGTNKKSQVTITVTPYTVIAKAGSTTAEIAFANNNLDAIQADLDKLAGMVADKKASFTVTIEGQPYTAKLNDKNQVTIGGKLLKDSVKAKGKTSVKVTVNVKTDKIGTLVAFVPATVKSVKVGNVTFTEFGNGTVKVNGIAVEYAVAGKNININAADNVTTVVNALKTVATVQ